GGRARSVAGRRARTAAVGRVALSPRPARGERAASRPGAGPGDPEAAPVGSPAARARPVRRAAARAPGALGRAGRAVMIQAGAVGPAALVAAAVAVPLFYVPRCESAFADPKLALLL